MEATVSILPKTEEVKKRMRIPLGVSVTPAKRGIARTIQANQSGLLRCSNCQAYLSPHCAVKEGKWSCCMCSSTNDFEENETSKMQISNENYQIQLSKAYDFDEVVCIYISLEFNDNDFSRSKLAVTGILRHIRGNCPCLIFIGVNGAPFALLVPPQKQKVFKLKNDPTSSSSIDEVPFQTTQKVVLPVQDRPVAAFSKFNSIEAFIGLDLAHFLFDKDTFAAAERAIDLLAPGKDTSAAFKCVELAGTIGKALQGTPVRFISLISSLPKVPPNLDALRPLPVRLDYIVSNYTKQVSEAARSLPGSVFILSSENPGGQGASIIQQNSVYQMIVHSRAHNCATEWKQIPSQCNEVKDQVAFYSVLPNDLHPLALDVIPLPNQESVSFQITSKYIANDGDGTALIFRVMNFCLKSSTNQEEIAGSANWNAILWFWMHIIYGKPPRESVSSLMRVAASVMANIGEFVPPDFSRAICGLRQLWFFSDDAILRYVGEQIFSQMSPSSLNLIAKKVEKDGRTILLTADGVEENGTVDGYASNTAREFQALYPIYIPIRSVINQKLSQIDQEYSQILAKLIKSLL